MKWETSVSLSNRTQWTKKGRRWAKAETEEEKNCHAMRRGSQDGAAQNTHQKQ